MNLSHSETSAQSFPSGTMLWRQLTLILQWYAEAQSCDELSLHQLSEDTGR